MTDLEKKFRRSYGAYKGLVTKYRNQGYTIEDTYTPPQKITQGSFRRLEQARREIQIQKEREEYKIYYDRQYVTKEARRVLNIARAYVEMTAIGKVGRSGSRGTKLYIGSAYELKESSLTMVTEIYLGALSRAKNNVKLYPVLAENMRRLSDGISDTIQSIILAAYKKGLAEWDNGRANWERLLIMLEYELNEGM